MFDKTKYYKEVIKSRMYKNATAIWGVRDVDDFDPILKLLVESLASEINKLSNELENLEARLLERLAGTLTPDIFLSVRPAHMIIHAKPAEEQATLRKSSSFAHRKKDNELIHFTPAGEFNLIDGDVLSIICAGKIYRFDNRKSKELVARSIRRSEKFNDKLWIGLHINPSLPLISNLSFYFDLPNIEKRNELLHLLLYSRWEQDDVTLSIRPGIYKESIQNNKYQPLADYDPSNLSNESILNHYSHRFITVRDEIVNKEKRYKIIPDELAELFPGIETSENPIPLLWLRVTLPPGFDNYVLEDFFVSVNAFPIINRKFYTKYTKVNPLVSVIPFETGNNEYFLSVDHVSDSNRRHYIHLPLRSHDEEDEFGTYILKRGGAERFDARNAKESVSNLMDLLREENTSFSLFGKGFVDELVKRIDSELVAIKLKLKELRAIKDITNYIVIDSNEIGDVVYTDYWVTNCEEANGIKSGITMYSFGNCPVNNDTLISLTQSYGGTQRNDYSPDMYKFVLTSRDRIFTGEDIINFCYARFGDKITDARISKGIRVSPRPKEGLIRSIDVHITLKDETGRDASNHQDMEDRLLALLKKRAPDMFNFRVFITNQTKR